MKRERGFTLIEIVVFIVIVSIAVVMVSLLFAQSAQHSSEPLVRQRSLALANAYMEEVFNKPWDENTPSGGGCVETGSEFCSALCDDASRRSERICTSETGVWAPRANSAPQLGPEAETRASFDDVDDYHGLDEHPPLKASTGEMLDGYAGYRVQVFVTHPGGPWNGIDARDVKRVQVVVTPPNRGESLRLEAYRVNN